MKGRLGDKERLAHILEAINHIEEFIANISYEQYMADFKLRLALIKLMEIIGEAAGSVSEETKLDFAEIEWNTLKSVRNILIHEYFGIDYDILWKSIQNQIPSLKTKMQAVIIKFN